MEQKAHQKILNKHKIFFADEMRFGLMTNKKRIGVRYEKEPDYLIKWNIKINIFIVQ